MLSPSNVGGRPPTPNAFFINDAQDKHYKIEPGKKYRFRIINLSALGGAALWFDQHKFTIVEIDGVETVPTEGEQLYIAPGQRYSVIVEGKKDCKTKNFAISVVMDTGREVLTPLPQLSFSFNDTAVLQYDDSKPDPAPVTVDSFNVVDDMTLKVGVPLLPMAIDYC